jgi:hypothetical protein
VRFRTRFDRWLVAVLALVAVVTGITLPALRLLAPGDHPAPLWLVFLPVPLWALVLASFLPQYYEMRKDGLFLRLGWRRVLIPYGSLVELRPASDSRSATAFSREALEVVARDGGIYRIAVAEEGRFVEEVARRCPHLERKGFGLG